MTYDNVHRILSKNQTHNSSNATVTANTYNNNYNYGSQNNPLPHAVKSIANNSVITDQFTYDGNGNTLTHNRVGAIGESKAMVWDEANQIKFAKVADAAVHHYIYDAAGERTFKGQGNVVEFRINGSGVVGLKLNVLPYTTYASGQLVINPAGLATLHYYSGTERIASRLVGAVAPLLSTNLPSTSTFESLASNQEKEIIIYTESQGWNLEYISPMTPPNFPCDKFLELDDPEGYKQCICEQDPTQCVDLLYYFHPDHLGSSTFLSDANGHAYQFLLYLPFGETMIEQKAAGWASPYRFNAKEQDDLTGMYYYGARYYDPRISVWHGVDPLAEMYPGWSPYAYTMNNPITYIDPTGMSTEEGDWPPNEGVAGQTHTDADGTFIHNGDGWVDTKNGSYVFPEVSISATNTSSSTIGTFDNYGDMVDPFIGLSALTMERAINKELLYHSFTLDEGFDSSLKRVSPVKTPFGSMKATTAVKTMKVLGGVGLGLNVISIANYSNDIYNGKTAKGVTGLGVMAATTALSFACPPCALAAIGISAGYSLYLEDKIFEEKKP